MNQGVIQNALSRRADVYICNQCGMDEAMMDMANMPPLSLNEWAMVKGFDQGEPQTFLDLLCSGEDIDCELIIGDCDMPASFVWDEDCHITGQGIKKYRHIMEAEFTKLENGNKEILQDFV